MGKNCDIATIFKYLEVKVQVGGKFINEHIFDKFTGQVD